MKIFQTRDGSLVLSCGDEGATTDLVFAEGAMHGDPLLDKQFAILRAIVAAREEEREKCAKIADRMDALQDGAIGAAIRAA